MGWNRFFPKKLSDKPNKDSIVQDVQVVKQLGHLDWFWNIAQLCLFAWMAFQSQYFIVFCYVPKISFGKSGLKIPSGMFFSGRVPKKTMAFRPLERSNVGWCGGFSTFQEIPVSSCIFWYIYIYIIIYYIYSIYILYIYIIYIYRERETDRQSIFFVSHPYRNRADHQQADTFWLCGHFVEQRAFIQQSLQILVDEHGGQGCCRIHSFCCFAYYVHMYVHIHTCIIYIYMHLVLNLHILFDDSWWSPQLAVATSPFLSSAPPRATRAPAQFGFVRPRCERMEKCWEP